MSEQPKTAFAFPIVLWVSVTVVCFVLFTRTTLAASGESDSRARPQARILPNINQYDRQQTVTVTRSNADGSALQTYPLDNVITDTPGLKGFGDRMYILQPGETGEIVAQQLTGRVNSWKSIAEYNKLGASPQLKAGQLIYIPEYLQRHVDTGLEPLASRTQYGAQTATFAPSGFNSYESESTKSYQSSLVDSSSALMPDSCLLYTSPSPRDATLSRMPSSA